VTNPILQTVELGSQWPTLDPFLFCAHHLDHYPEAQPNLGPAASLAGRSIGQDFANIDGWNMYHGDVVPGFPSHPHRGFETVTYVRRGWCDHSDSLGAQARFGEGDAQWLTAGAGIVHSEMFPLLSADKPNTLHLFQIWLNLPAKSKMVDPYFSMMWASDIPIVEHEGAHVTVIAGSYNGAAAPAPPPDSWAADPSNDVAIWHVRLDPQTVFSLPGARSNSSRVLYVFEGDDVDVAGQRLGRDTGVVLDDESVVSIQARDRGAEFLLLQGQPLNEPVAQHGPFVMNDRQGLEQAFADYQRSGFGGWPWPDSAPTHGNEAARFARHADGQVVAG